MSVEVDLKQCYDSLGIHDPEGQYALNKGFNRVIARVQELCSKDPAGPATVAQIHLCGTSDVDGPLDLWMFLDRRWAVARNFQAKELDLHFYSIAEGFVKVSVNQNYREYPDDENATLTVKALLASGQSVEMFARRKHCLVLTEVIQTRFLPLLNSPKR
jgi:hypothetical protein